jgi:ankyrin repeat protein
MLTIMRTTLSMLAVCIAVAASAQSAGDENLSTNARLLMAARNADADALKRELGKGAAIDSRNRLGETTLIIVLKKDRVDLAAIALDAGANVNLAAVNGITPLMAAAYGGHNDTVKRLLARGADPAALDRLGKNAMTYAAGEGRTEVVATLLAAGVNPNAVYANDLTALMWAAGFGKTETVQALLAAGANPALKDNRGKTAADMAREQGFAATVAVLDAARTK